METELKQGAVRVVIPGEVPVLEKAGKLSTREVSRQIKSYSGLGLCCQQTAQELQKNAGQILVPGIELGKMEEEALQAETIGAVINDLEKMLLLLKQNQILLAARGHRKLLRVLAFLKAYQKEDPHILESFPHLAKYFSKKARKPRAQPTQPEATAISQ